MTVSVQLGFLEPLEWTPSTQNDMSISRLGGLPSFPIPSPPEYKSFQCPTCNHPLRLLIQLYAPEADKEGLRVIYVFLCKDGRCQKPGFSPAIKVFRIQTGWNTVNPPQTCQICGLPGTIPSPSSEPFLFCTQEHCDRYTRSLNSTRARKGGPPQDIAWKPMEIVSEEEPGIEVDLDLEGMSLGSQRVEQSEETMGEEYSKSLGDRTFQKFVTRLERAPEQILRYLRIEGVENEVLICNASETLHKSDYPKCRNCHGPTDVEFQIMPGLLAQMDSDVGGPQELDWGVLNVLTCVGNCKSEEGWVEEWIWREEVSQEGLKSGV